MNHQLQNILANKSDGYPTIEAVTLPYLDLIKIEESGYRFGYCERGWLFSDQEHTSLIHWVDSNYIAMIKILEIEPKKLTDKLKKSIDEIDGKERRLVHNFGKKLPFETIDFGTPIICKLPDEQLLDYEVFSKWGAELGLIMEERENVDYLHLEVTGFKN